MGIAETWVQIESTLGPRWAPWPRGATSKSIAGCERALGRTLPTDYRESVIIHDGSRSFMGAYELSSLDEVIETATMFDEIVASLPSPRSGELRTVGPVEARRWNHSLIPIARTTSADTVLLDLEPLPLGNVGQVVHMTREMTVLRVLAPSFAVWLEQVASELPREG